MPSGPGTSRHAIARRRMKEEEPEKYQARKDQDKARSKAQRDAKKARRESGKLTKQELEEWEREKRMNRERKSRWYENNRVTSRTKRYKKRTPSEPISKRPRDMSVVELKAHKKAIKERWWNRLSSQKRTWLKKKRAEASKARRGRLMAEKEAKKKTAKPGPGKSKNKKSNNLTTSTKRQFVQKEASPDTYYVHNGIFEDLPITECFKEEHVSRVSENESSTNPSSFFQPNEECVPLIRSMGFSRNAAIRALFHTGNQSEDLAVGWILENNDKNLDIPLDVHLQASSDDEDFLSSLSSAFKAYKMVFVVNCELNMGTGKIAAQVAHAALRLFRNMMEVDSKAESIMAWGYTGEMKIVLRGDSTLHLETLAEQSATLKLDHYLVQDAGHTQVAPGSTTVLGVFGKTEDVDRVTGKLKLL